MLIARMRCSPSKSNASRIVRSAPSTSRQRNSIVCGAPCCSRRSCNVTVSFVVVLVCRVVLRGPELVVVERLDAAAGQILVVGEELDEVARAAGQTAVVLRTAASALERFEPLVHGLDANPVPAQMVLEDVACAHLRAATGAGLDEVAISQAGEHRLHDPAVVLQLMSVFHHARSPSLAAVFRRRRRERRRLDPCAEIGDPHDVKRRMPARAQSRDRGTPRGSTPARIDVVVGEQVAPGAVAEICRTRRSEVEDPLPRASASSGVTGSSRSPPTRVAVTVGRYTTREPCAHTAAHHSRTNALAAGVRRPINALPAGCSRPRPSPVPSRPAERTRARARSLPVSDSRSRRPNGRGTPCRRRIRAARRPAASCPRPRRSDLRARASAASSMAPGNGTT